MPSNENNQKILDEIAAADARNFPDLYHYTSIAVLYSILSESHELWFSSSTFLNDKRELLDFIDRLKESTFERVKPENQYKHSIFFNKLYSELQNQSPFVLCFSKRKDDAAQWERYGDNAKGVCIKFNTLHFSKLIHSFDEPAFFQNVCYDNKYNINKHELCYYVQRWIDEDRCDGFNSEDGLISNIIATAIAYKHQSFSAEEEVRVIILSSSFNSNICFDLQDGVIKKKIKLNYLQQCHKLGISTQELFDEIIIGPKSKQDLSTFKEYLTRNNCERIAEKVKKSECPLR